MTIRSARTTAALALVIAATACDSPTETVRISVNQATLEAVGDSRPLVATVNGSGRLPEWESLNPEILAVTPGGVATAVAPGAAVVQARIGAHRSRGTVTVLPPVNVQITSVTRGPDPSGHTKITLRLVNSGGRGFYRTEYWRMADTPGGEHHAVLRQLTDHTAEVGMEINSGTNLPGMEDVDWVVVYSREPIATEYRATGCIRLDGGTGCPTP